MENSGILPEVPHRTKMNRLNLIKNWKRYLFLAVLILGLIQPSSALASDPASLQDLETIFGKLIDVSAALLGFVLFFTFVGGGFTWATAGGDAKKLQQAQFILTFAIVGFVVFASGTLILQLIKQFTGVDLTIFRVRQ